jgi:hypothetical protein
MSHFTEVNKAHFGGISVYSAHGYMPHVDGVAGPGSLLILCCFGMAGALR